MENLQDYLLNNKNNKNIELEIRYYLDLNKPNTHINNIIYTPDILYTKIKQFIRNELNNNNNKLIEREESINYLITKDNLIKKYLYKNGEKIGNKNDIILYSKNQLLSPLHNNINYKNLNTKISLSEEIIKNVGKSNKIFNNKNIDLIRLKLRYSLLFDNIKYPNLKNWRLDITFIKTLNELDINSIRFNKNKLFKEKNIRNIDNFDYIEIETEYISNDYTNINKQIMNSTQAIDILLDIKDNNENENNNNKKLNNINYIKEISEILNKNYRNNFKLNNLSNNPIELNNNSLDNIKNNINNYYITEKIDGLHSFLYSSDDNNIVIITPKKTIYKNKEGAGQSPNSKLSKTILEGEWYEDKFYIFDIIMYKNNNVSNNIFENRLEYFDKAKEIFDDIVIIKKFIKLNSNNYKNEIKSLYNSTSDKEYETDGLIFIENNLDYNNTKTFKWKPIEKSSIDFLVKKCTNPLLGLVPYSNIENKTLYLLFSYINKNRLYKMNMNKIKHYNYIFTNNFISKNYPYIPIQFSPSLEPYAHIFYSDNTDLDNKICELIRKNNEWKLLKIREDKFLPNNYFTAENIFMNYLKPITINDIINNNINTNFNYFKNSDNKINLSQRSYVSFVKEKLIKTYCSNMNYVIDLGSGKGQDLYRYARAKINNLLCIDSDKNGLQELINRKHQMIKQNNKFKMNIMINNMDLNLNYADNLINIFNNKMFNIPYDITCNSLKGVDIVICNLAFHYLIKSKKNIINISNFIKCLLKKKGLFIFTAYDGNAVINILKKYNNNYIIKNNNNEIKYHIKAKFKQLKLTKKSQEIDVKLPFSGDNYYTENLVNIDIIKQIFSKLNFELIENNSFSVFLDEYNSSFNLTPNKILDEFDREYISLYHYYIFKLH